MRLHKRAWQSLFMVLSLLVFSVSQAQEKTPDPQQEIHDNLVKSALLNDAFNKRCRGMSLTKNFNQVNRLFITKYSVSANNYIEAFIAEDYRDYKEQFTRHFNQVLAQKKGCQAAKDQDWDKQMQKEFRDLYRQAEQSNWFPIINL